MGTINYTCEFGVVHRTAKCRCMSTHIEKHQIKCDVPDAHDPNFMSDGPRDTPQTLHDRLSAVLSDFFGTGPLMTNVVQDALTDNLESVVRAWLVDQARKIGDNNE